MTISKEERMAATDKARARSARKKTYERPRESALPQELIDHFKKDDYELKLVRWASQGVEDYRYLNRREREGYEFVTASEIPPELMKGLITLDTKTKAGLIIVGDLCLMKIDKDLRQSRRDAYASVTDREVESVDIHVLEKKGFKNLGTKSRVMMREPKFGD